MQPPVHAFSGAWIPPLPGGESVGVPVAVPLAAVWPVYGVLPALPPPALQPSSLPMDMALYDVSCHNPDQVSTLPVACNT